MIECVSAQIKRVPLNIPARFWLDLVLFSPPESPMPKICGLYVVFGGPTTYKGGKPFTPISNPFVDFPDKLW